MGTNYYWQQEPHPAYGNPANHIHIGKSSGGWAFTLHVYPEGGWDLPDGIPTIKSLEEWEAIWSSKGAIIDEYGEIIKAERMSDIVRNRLNPSGPLRRHTLDSFCIGHGEGTWDYCVGEFS